MMRRLHDPHVQRVGMCESVMRWGDGGVWNAFTVPSWEGVLMQYVAAHTYMHVRTCLI